VKHNVPAVALRIEEIGAPTDERDTKPRSLAYSGDSLPCPGLTAASEGADVLIADAYSSALAPPGSMHMTPSDVGRLASETTDGRVLLTHLHSRTSPQEAIEEATITRHTPVELATPMITLSW
jgi:ribonuclease BN (tRNA processing enzyme)